MDNSVVSVKVVSGPTNEKCKFFTAQSGSDVLAENVGTDPVVLGDGKGVAVGRIRVSLDCQVGEKVMGDP